MAAPVAGFRLCLRRHSTAAASAMSLLRFENDPVRILSICRDAALSPTVHPDRAALSLAVSALSAAGSTESVRSLLGGLLSSSSTTSALGGDSHVRSHAIVLFGQAGMLADAIRTFKESKSTPSARSLNALLFACILSKNHAEVPKIFQDFTNSYGINPNLDTYNTLIKAFCESGSSRRFFAVLDEMVRMKIKPNLTTFCISLAGFYREGLFDDVRKVLWLMKKHRCRASLEIYNVRIQSLCKLKRSIEAKDLLKEMLKKGRKPNWVTYDHLILGFCNEGDLEEAKKLYMEMGMKGLMPERSCYSSLIYYLCKGGDFETALQVARDSMERNITPRSSIMKLLVNGLVSVSKVDEARDIIAKVKDLFPGRADIWKEGEENMP